MFILYFIVFVLLLIHISTRYSRKGRLYNKIPGPWSLPLFGNLLEFINSDQNCSKLNKCFVRKAWLKSREFSRKYYPISRLWAFNQALVNVFHPDDLEILLSSQSAIEKGYIYGYYECWLRRGLLTGTGKKWRQRRKILTPAFHYGILKKYMDITIEQGEKMIASLKAEGSETVRNVETFFSHTTLNIICESTMGVALDKLDISELTQYRQAIDDINIVCVFRFLRPYLIDPIFKYMPKMWAMQKQALEILHGFTDKVVQRRKEYHKSNGDKLLNDYENVDGFIYNESEVGLKRRLVIIDLLLALEKKGLIDNTGIKEEVDTFIFAGHDTISAALTYTTLLLAENKEAQNLARAEVTAIMDTTNGKAGVAEIQEFHYLERCIKESMRLYPPVSSVMRRTGKDLQLKHGLIPAGTEIMIHFWDTHRDPKFWPEPEKFDPDRFLPENLKNRHPFSYLPFSAGSRNCIGQKFAMMEMKLLMARILYNFYLEPMERTTDLRFLLSTVLKSVNPVHVKFSKINK